MMPKQGPLATGRQWAELLQGSPGTDDLSAANIDRFVAWIIVARPLHRQRAFKMRPG